MYSRQRCFSSILEAENPCMHSSRNSRVRWGSFLARVSLTDLMNIVLLLGMQSPLVSSKCPSIFRSKVEVRAHTGLICRLAAEHWPSQHLDPKPPVHAPIPIIMTQLGTWSQNDRSATNFSHTSFQSQRKPSHCNQPVQTVDTLARGRGSQIMEQSVQHSGTIRPELLPAELIIYYGSAVQC